MDAERLERICRAAESGEFEPEDVVGLVQIVCEQNEVIAGLRDRAQILEWLAFGEKIKASGLSLDEAHDAALAQVEAQILARSQSVQSLLSEQNGENN